MDITQGSTFADTPGLTREVPSSPEDSAMRMRLHRRNLVVWGSSAAPARRSGDQGFTRLARGGRIRRRLRTGTLLTVIGVMRLARIMRARWRLAFLLTGTSLMVIGVMLPSVAAFFSGMLVVPFALQKGMEASDDGCWIPFVGRWPPAGSDSSLASGDLRRPGR